MDEPATCDHKGCNTGWPAYPAWMSPADDEPDAHYCMQHMADEGFCAGCGQFWAGVEDFDFDPRGLCSNCRDDPDWNDDMDEWDDADAYDLAFA